MTEFVALDRVGKRFQDHWALKDISLNLDSGSFTSVIGPSGAGKSTLLRLLAGLIEPDMGEIRFSRPPSLEHPAVLVFQDFWLFPGLSVYENIAFGLRARRLGRDEIQRRVEGLLDDFAIADQARKVPRQLSAGQQQRVALARALAVRPSLLLLDEPFAHLDWSLKAETARYLRQVHEKYQLTTLTVTHDVDEAFVMSDRIGVVVDGSLIRTGSPREVLANPGSSAAASLLGRVIRLPLELAVRAGCDIPISGDSNSRWCWLRPDDVEIVPLSAETKPADRSASGTAIETGADAGARRGSSPGLVGTVVAVDLTPNLVFYTLEADGHRFFARSLEPNLQPGDRARVFVRRAFLDQDGQEERN